MGRSLLPAHNCSKTNYHADGHQYCYADTYRNQDCDNNRHRISYRNPPTDGFGDNITHPYQLTITDGYDTTLHLSHGNPPTDDYGRTTTANCHLGDPPATHSNLSYSPPTDGNLCDSSAAHADAFRNAHHHADLHAKFDPDPAKSTPDRWG